MEMKYKIELRETYPLRRKEVVESTTQDLTQLIEDFIRALDRLFGEDVAKYMVKDQMLPVIVRTLQKRGVKISVLTE